MKNRLNLFRTVAAATLVTGLAPGVAAAQQTQATPSASNNDDTIVVTARRKEEALQDVPIAVTAFTARTIEDRGIANTTDLAAFTPGFSFNEAFGRDGDRPVIRGTSNILNADGKVGIFLDGAPVIGDSSSLDLESLQRVEIIKGPQSAVYGRGTLSGAINYVSRTPGDAWEGKVEGTMGNWGRTDFYTRISGPLPTMGLVHALHGFASYKTYNFSGDYNNKLDIGGRRLGAQGTDTLNIALFADITDNLHVVGRYINSSDNDGLYAIGLQPASANNCFLATRPTYCGVVQTPNTFALNKNDIAEPGLQRDTERGFLTISWDNVLGTGFSLTYQGTTSHQLEVTGNDQSYDAQAAFIFPTPATCPFLGASLPNRICNKSNFNDTSGADDDYVTHEVRMQSPQNLPIRFGIGVFNLERVRKNDFKYLELTAAGPDPAGARSSAYNNAVYGNIEWDVTPRFTVGLELRDQVDIVKSLDLGYAVSKQFPTLPVTVLNGNPNLHVDNASAQTVARPNVPVRSVHFDKTLPRLTLDYHVSDDVLVYAQYAQGDSPGGFNPSTAPDPYKTFSEEELDSYEAGIKSSAFGFDYLNFDVFYMNYKNQVLSTTIVNATQQISVNYNIGEQEIKGFELEAQKKLFDGFTLAGTLSYVDGSFTSGTDPQQALFQGGGYCTTSYVAPGFSLAGTTGSVLPTTPATTNSAAIPASTSCAVLGSIVGKKSPLVPPMQASLSGRYEREIGDLNYFVGGEVTYRDSFFAQVDNLQETGSSFKVNAQLGVEGDHWKATLWGKNLTNETAAEGILRYLDFNAAASARPASPGFRGTPRAFAVSAPRKPAFGVTVAYNF